MRNLNCIICDNKSHKGHYTKYRISESDRAKAFLAATNYFQDAVYPRTYDLQDENSVFGVDLYYHSICMKKYLKRFEARDKNVKPKMSQKQVAWDQIVRELEQGLKDGQGYELSVIRDHLNNINSDCKFRNRDVKVYLTS